jgi:hypothetical protein
MAAGKQVKRATLVVIGGVVLLIGVALLVLPGPGVLLVLAGLWLLASEFPALERYVNPVRDWAMKGRAGQCALAVAHRWVGPVRPYPHRGRDRLGSASLPLAAVARMEHRVKPDPVWNPALLGLLGWSYRKVATRRR